MKIIHHQYKSHPCLSVWKDPEKQIRLDEVCKALRVGMGRLKVWQHIEVQGVKLDGIETSDIRKAAKRIASDLDMSVVVREEANRVRIWMVPKDGDWKTRARRSLEYGADENGSMIEYKAKPKAVDTVERPKSLQRMKDSQDVQ